VKPLGVLCDGLSFEQPWIEVEEHTSTAWFTCDQIQL